MVLEKDADQLVRSCEKQSITYGQGGKKHPTYNETKEFDWSHVVQELSSKTRY